jgi:hypothetical protein
MPVFALALPALELAFKFLPAQSWMRYFNMAFGIVASGINIAERFKALNAEIQAMVDEGRGPTDAEWAALLTEDDRIYLSIEAAPLNPE